MCLFVEAKQILWFYSLESIALTLYHSHSIFSWETSNVRLSFYQCVCIGGFPGRCIGTTCSTWLLFVSPHICGIPVAKPKCEFHPTDCRHTQPLPLFLHRPRIQCTHTANWLATLFVITLNCISHGIPFALWLWIIIIIMMIWFYTFEYVCGINWARLGASR